MFVYIYHISTYHIRTVLPLIPILLILKPVLSNTTLDIGSNPSNIAETKAL
jgi:hypothetical protein